MSDQDRAGARMAALRKARGLTQRQLAERASVSYSLLTKVESGAAPATPAVIGAVARALRVDVPRITGQPYEESRGQAARLQLSVDGVRRSVDTYDLPSSDITPRPYAQLAADVKRVSDLGQAAKFVQIGAELPGLLDELSAAIHGAPERDQPLLYALLAEAYSGASAIANLLGYLDLRNQVVDRIRWASKSAGTRFAFSGCDAADVFLHVCKRYGQAETLMNQLRAISETTCPRWHGRTLSVDGSLTAIGDDSARAPRTSGPRLGQEAWAHIDSRPAKPRTTWGTEPQR